MSAGNTPNLNFVRLEESQQNAEAKVNTILNLLDCLVQPSALQYTATPPGSPADGAVYLIAPSATGAWTGQDGKVAIYFSGWIFLTPKEGWTFWVSNTNRVTRWDGSSWRQAIKVPTFSTANRPASPTTSEMIFDTTLGIPIWWDGSNWIDALGTTV